MGGILFCKKRKKCPLCSTAHAVFASPSLRAQNLDTIKWVVLDKKAIILSADHRNSSGCAGQNCMETSSLPSRSISVPTRHGYPEPKGFSLYVAYRKSGEARCVKRSNLLRASAAAL